MSDVAPKRKINVEMNTDKNKTKTVSVWGGKESQVATRRYGQYINSLWS